MSENKSMHDLIDELAEAENRLEQLQSEERQARTRATDCLNLVNSLQKKIDEKYEQIKKQSNLLSDWGTGK